MTAFRTCQFANCLEAAEDEAKLHVPTLERYWNDPAFASQHDAERAEWQHRTHAMIDEGMRKTRESRANAINEEEETCSDL